VTASPRPLDVDKLRAYAVPEQRDRYDPRDAILYALGVGAGLSEVDETRLVFERDLCVLPSMALVLGTPGFWLMDRATGLDWPQILHGAQSFRLHGPLAVQGDIKGRTTIGALADKGLGKPALLRCTRELIDGASGAPVASLQETWVLRGAGGFGGPRDLEGDDPSVAMPDRAPDMSLALPTSRNQAMLYRLNGDRNPLHVSNEIATSAGFERPILHGLSTMGLVGRALIHLVCDGAPARLSAMRVRFTAPVYPGETIRSDVWQEGGAILFRAVAIERDVIALDGGVADIDTFG